MKIGLYFLFIITTTNLWANEIANPVDDLFAHDFHLSKCQIDYSESTQALQIMMHI